jgi:hypothetical protein
MQSIKFYTIGIVTLAGLFIGSTAVAATPTDCKDKVDAVSITGVFNADTARIAELNSKLEGASLVLVQNEFKKALSELETFQAKVTALSKDPKAKISGKDATPLLGDVDKAITCVKSLIGG